MVWRIEHLHDPLFFQLLEPFLELLLLREILAFQYAEALGRKLWNRIKCEWTIGAKGVADGKEAGVHKPDDIARVGLFNCFTVTAEEPVWPRHPDLPVYPSMIHLHVLFVTARHDT